MPPATIAEPTTMKIVVNRVPTGGMTDQAAYDPAALDLIRFDVRHQHPIAVSAFIVRTEGDLVVQAQIAGRLEMTCARCLSPFERPLTMSTTLTYDVQPTDVVDITDDVRQEVILAYPMIPVCHADCKGLCPVCGQNLNSQACEHA